MDPRFQPHNTHLDSPGQFTRFDPQLRQLRLLPLKHHPALLDRLPVGRPGIYTIGGGRQIGKTTLLKLWMAQLLKDGTPPEAIAYLTGELIDDHHSLVRLLTDHLGALSLAGPRYVLLDEVTYIREWDKGIKFLADAGLLEDVILVLTGSDIVVVRDARMRLPGRRGSEDVVDFRIYPLSFAETVLLEKHLTSKRCQRLAEAGSEPRAEDLETLFRAFDDYLIHGGFLTAINDMARDGSILPATLAIYSDWIRGDVLKRRKQEHYLREILSAILHRAGSPVTWNNLAQELSVDHPQTVSDYVALLESMDVVCIRPALREDQLRGAPKRARKVTFADPFIAHAINSWLHPVRDPFRSHVLGAVKNPDLVSHLVEACVASHIRRSKPTYYIKAHGEVDIAYVDGRRFWPIEVKWSQQIRPKDVGQVAKYENGSIWGRSRQFGRIQGVPVEPLPLALLRWELSTAHG